MLRVPYCSDEAISCKDCEYSSINNNGNTHVGCLAEPGCPAKVQTNEDAEEHF